MKRYISIFTSLVLTLTLLCGFSPAAGDIGGAAVPAVYGKTAAAETVKEAAAVTNAAAPAEAAESAVPAAPVPDEEPGTETFFDPEEADVTVLDDGSAFINDTVSVFFKEDADEDEINAVVASVNGETVSEYSFLNEREVKVGSRDLDGLLELCDGLMENESVEFASCSTASLITEDAVPDDPWGGYSDWSDTAVSGWRQPNNWWIKATDTDKAWDYSDSFSEIKIGIVDSGFYTEHEDLKGKIEFPGRFYEKRNAPDDHGTHVAGIIGAIHNNNLGISGIVDKCKMVCVDWHANKDQGQHWISELRIMSGFVKCVKAGAKVVNFSLGSSGTITNGTTDRYQIIKDIEGKYTSYIMAKLLQRGYDFICCQSAGNGTDMKDGSSYAVNADNNGTFCTVTEKNAVGFVIGVSKKDIVDRIIITASARYDGYGKYSQSSFSNGGPRVSICSPGSYVYSCYWDPDDDTKLYSYLSGTSMASPVTTGITALVWSVNPGFTGAQVKKIVCDPANTKYMVADSTDPTHLPEGEIPMINAQLAVEAALREAGKTGTVTGTAATGGNRCVNIEIKSSETGEIYRLTTGEDGSFSYRLPFGDYNLFMLDGEEYSLEFTVYPDKTTELGVLFKSEPGISIEIPALIAAEKLEDLL